MAMNPGPLVPAPEPIRRRPGLFDAVPGPLDLPPHGRGGGVRYVPVTCGPVHSLRIGCYDGLPEVPEGGKPTDPAEGTVVTGVFATVTAMECGTVGYTAAEDANRIRRRLEAGEQGAVEAAFWSGLDFNGDDLDIMSLADDPDEITGADDLDIIEVVAALEDYAYRAQGYGYVAYLHAPVAVAAHAGAANLTIPDRDGRTMRTPFGSVWVFGGGYAGTGPDLPSGGAFIHITGQISAWRSPDVQTYPVDQVMDRTTNQRLLLAEREWAVSYDCFNGRAAFDPLGGVS
jgi:hypothetical protein